MSDPVLSKPVELTEPVKRGETEIKSVQIRKPKAGELRGCKLSGLVQSDVDEHLRLLPRITMPPLLTNELEQMDPQDFGNLVGSAIVFFMSEAQLAALDQVQTS